MANKILVRRGLQANLPTSGLSIGEPFFATDTKKFYVADSATTMIEYARVASLGTASAVNTGTSAGNVPVLDGGGKLPIGVLPALAITSSYVVASEVAQLALSAQEGDVAIRTDESKTYIHNGGSAGTMADWTLLATPTGGVLSVNGFTGAVTLTTTDIAEGTNKRYLSDTQKTEATRNATTSQNGLLSSTDWNTFNTKLGPNDNIDGGTF